VNGLIWRKKGVVAVVLAIVLLATLFVGQPATTYGDGIGEPIDGLNSTLPSGTEGTSATLESLVLYVALNLVI
jgi:hypothetical protein